MSRMAKIWESIFVGFRIRHKLRFNVNISHSKYKLMANCQKIKQKLLIGG
jgi:hypothetical protein